MRPYLLVYLVAPAIMLAGFACGSSMPTAGQQASETGWGIDDGACINNGGTKAQVDYCRDQLRVLFCGDGGMLADSGGCAHVTLSDGGRP